MLSVINSVDYRDADASLTSRLDRIVASIPQMSAAAGGAAAAGSQLPSQRRTAVKPTTSLRHRRSWSVVLSAIMLGAGLFSFGLAPAAVASPQPGGHEDVVASSVQSTYNWGPVSRTCSPSNYNCRVSATGGAGWQYHKRDGVTAASWKNERTETRTSYHGTGAQTASVTAHNSLSGASATCVCTSAPCYSSTEERG